MEYTVARLSRLAGISPRTLRYYDTIGLLKPARVNTSGYRLYGPAQVDCLQQILFYRELGLPLKAIHDIVSDPSFDRATALCQHRDHLIQKRNRLSTLILNIDTTIEAMKGKKPMSDVEKFEGFKEALIQDNEKKYGKEIREKYGNNTVETSNQRIKNLTREQHEALTSLDETLMAKLRQAKAQGDPNSALAQEVADLHRQWLAYYWPSYSKQAHATLAQMYVDDERFTAFYDKEIPGTAQFLRDAILIYTGIE